MKTTTHTTPAEFLRVAGKWLEEREVENSMMLGLAMQIERGQWPSEPPPTMITVAATTGLVAAAMATPPWPVKLYVPGDAPAGPLELVAAAFSDAGQTLDGCMGSHGAANIFAEIWSGRTGQRIVRKCDQRIYELHKVAPPGRIAGAARGTRTDDLDILAQWVFEFNREVGQKRDVSSCRVSAEQSIVNAQSYLWEDRGQPVCMAFARRPTRRGMGIGSVYTPPRHRRHGYASALVAWLSQRQLDAGREFCCLYTDASNPTSNSIYQKIGYVPVADSTLYLFEKKEQP
jgi:predicted GNAT family acetyltransferase